MHKIITLLIVICSIIFIGCKENPVNYDNDPEVSQPKNKYSRGSVNGIYTDTDRATLD